MNVRKSKSASPETQVASQETEVESEAENATPKKHDKRALLVFFSFVAGLVVLVALNMK